MLAHVCNGWWAEGCASATMLAAVEDSPSAGESPAGDAAMQPSIGPLAPVEATPAQRDGQPSGELIEGTQPVPSSAEQLAVIWAPPDPAGRQVPTSEGPSGLAASGTDASTPVDEAGSATSVGGSQPMVRSLYQRLPMALPGDGVAATGPGAGPRVAASAPHDGPPAVCTAIVPVRAPGDGRRFFNQRREGAASADRPPTAVATAPLVAPTHEKLKGKGARHANVAAGPWVSALAHMPPLPPSGRKRAEAGLSLVPLVHSEKKAVKAERAARALVAILPRDAAAFVLEDDPADVAARPPADVAEQLVTKLKAFGVSSLEGAYSSLGRLLAWVAANRPPGTAVGGSVASDFLAASPSASHATILNGWRWLGDWCGVKLPARGPACRGFRTGQPASTHDTHAFGLWIVMGLEWLAVHHANEYVRGHAAAWLYMALHALRREQAAEHVINAWVPHGGVSVTVAAVLADKHPDPSKRRPRPVWGCFDGLCYPGKAREALVAALEGAESVRCVLRDTDSPDGDPTRADAWLLAAVDEAPRADASLQSLLQLEPICLTREQAARYHGHSAKRFLLGVIEGTPSLDPAEDGGEAGRFSGSTAQNTDLEPVAAMLRKHQLRCSVLPGIYARKAKVEKTFDRAAALQSVLVAAAARVTAGRAIPREHGFASAFEGL